MARVLFIDVVDYNAAIGVLTSFRAKYGTEVLPRARFVIWTATLADGSERLFSLWQSERQTTVVQHPVIGTRA